MENGLENKVLKTYINSSPSLILILNLKSLVNMGPGS